jgi:tetratricopeptide (TPR) repeat protein
MSPQLLGLILLFAVLVVTAVIAFAVVRHAPRSRAADTLGGGDFAAALDAVALGPDAGREDLYSAAIAAKHLLHLDQAAELLDRILSADPTDGEAWLERGLVAAYREEYPAADASLGRAAAERSDLAESVALHRAWVALQDGRPEEGRRLFEEIEAPLESKLRVDLGPGEPLFAEWFLHAAALWRSAGSSDRAAWARSEGLRSAPGSRLAQRLGSDPP